MMKSGASNVKLAVRVRKRTQTPSVSADELDRALSRVKDNVTCLLQPDNDCGISYLRLATCIFSRLVHMERPCLDVVVLRDLVDPENSSPQMVAASDNDVHEYHKSADKWVNVAATGYTFGDGSPDFFNKYDVVAVGGTFDRLHAGHRLLLTAAGWAARRKLIIGVTAEPLLRNKQHKELIKSFEERSSAALSYAQQVKSSLRAVEVVELVTPQGPTTSDPEINAIVVSIETVNGAKKINETRVAAGLKPMNIIVVDVLDTEKRKLSSSVLREAEYDTSCSARSGV